MEGARLAETKQLNLFRADKIDNGSLKDPAAMENKKLPIHRWVTWIAGFSASFANDVIEKYLPKPKLDSLVLDPFAGVGTTLVEALGKLPKALVHQRSFFDALQLLGSASVDLVITSPPYLNNYHYVRNTRPHLFWLNFVSQPKDLESLEQESYGKFWQTVRDAKPIDLHFSLPELENIIEHVKNLKTEKGVYGGPGWANYITTYFNDTHRFMATLKELLKPNGTAVIVVGNSIIQGIEIHVDEFFSRIAALHCLETDGIHIVREKRTGSSIVNTGAREKSHKKPELYDAAIVLKW